MKYNLLEKAGFKISQVSFGCMSLTASGKENDTLIGKAIRGGINLFDTADLYEKGQNELLLGNAVKHCRKDIVLSTKVGNKWKEDGSGWDWCPDKKHILSAVDESLKRLQTDYIDLYMLHGGTINDPFDETIEAFEILKDSGKIRSYGLSSIRPNVIREFIEKSNIAAVMTQYSLLDTRPEEETLQLLQQNNVGILARGTLASGLLVDKPAEDYLGISKNEVAALQQKMSNVVANGRTKSETAMRYAIDNPAVTTAVIGIRTLKQLEDALTGANATPLTAGELKILQELHLPIFYTEHR